MINAVGYPMYRKTHGTARNPAPMQLFTQIENTSKFERVSCAIFEFTQRCNDSEG
jgi:hypothetical protein